jgi:hypothetical protein
MRWRSNDWPAYRPRPKVAKLSTADLERLHASVTRFVARSRVLSAVVAQVTCARGRVYVWREGDDLWARLTPLSRAALLLETPWRTGWSEYKRGEARSVLASLERDPHGTLHGLGVLVRKRKDGRRSVQEILHDDHGVPLSVVAEPRHWYELRRQPAIAEVDRDRGRILARFESFGPFGGFGGTCLYAQRDGEWDCYTIKPSAAATIESAEAWLVKRSWEDWG